ncbi:MAG: hypothetical protein EPO26_05760 [Chloroflexota bacterium]|nr:MAG: hypothetical protein EPO26_05760 [Chloroflexota bacterium]
MSDIVSVVAWWVALQVFGLAALPVALRVFRNLPDRGFFLARPVGLILTGFIYWHAGTFGILRNTWESVVAILIIVAAIGWLGCRSQIRHLGDLLRERRAWLVTTEALFTVAFLVWVAIRAFDPDITATEKPMELLFLNGVLRSPFFPPIDPWLSGFSISYYFFGYLIAGMLASLTATPAQVAFNLMLPSLFALSATGAFGIGLALAHGGSPRRGSRFAIAGGLITVATTLLVTNLEPVLEVLNANRLLSPDIQRYFAIKDMPNAYQSARFFPSDNWWWFRATRVIGTTVGDGRAPAADYTINEFPFFSFILGDMHPHVLALPFLFLAIGIALNLARAPGTITLASLRRDPWFVGSVGIAIGGLGFLNTWDMPTMLFVLAGAFAIRQLRERGVFDIRSIREIALGFVGATALCIALYLPFYLTFRSQAAGLGVVITKTQFHHFLLFWGPTFALLVVYLLTGLYEARRDGPPNAWYQSRITWLLVTILAAVAVIVQAPVVAATVPLIAAALAIVTWHGARAVAAPSSGAESADGNNSPIESPLAAFIALTGFLLVLGCEIVFIRDFFGNRMNTVFKLYYQAWVLLAIASGFAIPQLIARAREVRRPLTRATVSAVGAVIVIAYAATLLYPIGAVLDKTRDFGHAATLDGIAFWGRSRPDELAAIRWLRRTVVGAPVIVEATGGSYRQEFGRVASMTGLPTLLGWDYHEQQWRGTFEEAGARKPDIDLIYRSNESRQVLQILAKYNATYVFVGQTERDVYGRQGADLERFGQFMDVAFRSGAVTVYRVREGAR